MKKKILSVILIFTMILSSVSVASALNFEKNNYEMDALQNVVTILDKMPELDGVIGDVSETAETFTYEAEDIEMIIPKTGDDFIETYFDSNQSKIGMQLPEEVSNSEAAMTSNGTVVFTSDCENVDVLVQMLEDEQGGFVFSGIRAMMLIKDITAPTRYDFTFELPEGASLITSDAYKKTYYPNDNDWIGDNLVFVIDKEGEILSTIDEAWAKDANGELVKTFYEINGNVLTQVVNFSAENAFPIIADPTNTGIKTKVETLSVDNKQESLRNLIQARREVNERQNNSLESVISLINSVFGLFNIVTGIFSMAISGVVGGNAAFLEKCEDTYTRIYEGLTSNEFKDAEIYFTYRGSYQGKNKGYAYRIQDITNNRVEIA